MAKLQHFFTTSIFFILVSWPPFSLAQTALDTFVQSFLAKTYATAALMSDDEVIKFGILDFNPNDVVNLRDDNLGSEQSTRLRESLRQFNIPFRWRLSANTHTDSVWLIAKLAYLDLEQKLQLTPSNSSGLDRIDEKLLSAGAGLGYKKALDKHWELVLESYLTWISYRNDVKFNTPESRQLAPFLDGVLTNIDAETLLAEPAVGLQYNWSTKSAHYQLFTKHHYLKGHAINADSDAHEARTEAWYWTNGIALKRPLPIEGWSKHTLWFRLARTDLGGDLDEAVGENHYYEAGVAWLVDASKNVGFIDNLGVGININYGSDLRGGTLIFLYNFTGFR